MSIPYDRDALRGRVAVVAGATRGAGRGIAAALGEAVRLSSALGAPAELDPLLRTMIVVRRIEETAELVTSLGGNGIAVATDHLLAYEVKTLAERLHNERKK